MKVHSDGVAVAVATLLQFAQLGLSKTIAISSYASGPAANAAKPSRQQLSEVSSGRGFSGGTGSYSFPLHPSYLSKPIPISASSDNGPKTPKYIVYPSFPSSNLNTVQYYTPPQRAMDRFAPGEAFGGSLYKVKHKHTSPAGVAGAAARPIAAASSNNVVRVPSPAFLRPAASDSSPVTILPPIAADSKPPPKPPMMMIAAPTPVPADDSKAAATPNSSGMVTDIPLPDILTIPLNVDISNDSSPSLDGSPEGSSASSEEADNAPVMIVQEKGMTSDNVPAISEPHTPTPALFKFPPNSDSQYSPPSSEISNNPVTSYLPLPSGDPNEHYPVYSPNIHEFPPNSDSQYLPPITNSSKASVTSYLPPPSGNPADTEIVKPAISPSYSAPPSAFKFPPNSDSQYLPPSKEVPKSAITSYLPPASGNADGILMGSANTTNSSKAYSAPPELYRFPPNLNSQYLPSSEDSSKGSITSYLPPASGDPEQTDVMPSINAANISSETPAMYSAPPELFKFPPNINSQYLPPSDGSSESPVNSYLPPPSGTPNISTSGKSQASTTMYMAPPELFKFPPNIHSQYLPPAHQIPKTPTTSYLPPASGNPNAQANMVPAYPMPYSHPPEHYKFGPNGNTNYLPPDGPNMSISQQHGMSDDSAVGTISVGPGAPQYLPPGYGSLMDMSSGMAMSSGPPMSMPPMDSPTPMGPPMDMPPPSGMGYDHHHDHPPFEYPFDFSQHDHFPEIIYDQDHDHYFHHHDEPPPTTTPAPPPPPPPDAATMPRLKNYSYYYLSRTLWYVPLYFTLYFTFYVAILIIRSIARHKVNIPNNWVGNQRSFGSVRDLSNAEIQRKTTMMANFTMRQIVDFKEKYL